MPPSKKLQMFLTLALFFSSVAEAHASRERNRYRRDTALPEKPSDHPEQQLPTGITVEQMKAAEPPRDPADVQNWFGTSLYGFENCGDGVEIIKRAYRDANKIVNLKGVKSDISWDSAAAFEYFGPAPLNTKQRPQIQAVLANMATVYDGWAPGVFANWIHARCDDPRERCTIKCDAATEGAGDGDDDDDKPVVRAYSLNPTGPNKMDWPYINFCPGFFGLPSLDAAVDRNSKEPARKRFDVENYVSTATTFLHELFHLDLAADSVGGKPNPKVRDIKIRFYYNDKTGQRVLSKLQGAYGALKAKVLARFVPSGGQYATGYYVQRNDDSLGRFALAKYVESRIGGYPFLPQVNYHLREVREPPARPNSHRLPLGVSWDVHEDGAATLNLTLAAVAPATPDDDGLCPGEEAGGAPGEDDFQVGAPHRDEEYPEWYRTLQREWLDMIQKEEGDPAGTCGLNLTQVWTCEPVESNLYARVTITDSAGDVVYSTPGSTRTPGQPINDKKPLELKEGGMKNTLKIVGQHVNDYVQFYYGDSAWTSGTKEGPASCKLVGDNWDKNGPANCQSKAFSRQFECVYPC